MARFKTILIFVLIILLFLSGIFWYGRYLGRRAATPEDRPLEVSSQLILDRISNQYFLVTKTVFMDSKAEIETPKHDDWKDLFVGSKITVRGLIRVDVGVDAKGLGLKDIMIDPRQKTVTISLPPAAILDASLYGELDIDEDKAILDKLKSLFQDTRNEDYNRALNTLLDVATSQVSAEGRIFNEARADAIKLVELIVANLLKDYHVIVK